MKLLNGRKIIKWSQIVKYKIIILQNLIIKVVTKQPEKNLGYQTTEQDM